MIQNKRIGKTRIAVGIAAALSLSSMALADNAKMNLDIAEQVANKAILDLASQTNVQIVLKTGSGEGVLLPGLKGEFTLEQALEKMLAGTGLTFEYITENSILVQEGEREEEESGKGEKGIDEEVIVTGSRLIKNPGQLTRQITIFDREEIERSGATRLDEFLNRLPQNLNAPTNVGSGFPNDIGGIDFGLGNNAFAGSSVNLRGLGSQYTLILIDGRRPPRGGQFGGITDISNIPVERVQRIEVLFDGAAAIYGADAVGGVVNIITRKDYDGTDVSLTYADTTDGGGARVNFNVGHTFGWESGSLTTTLTYQGQEAIDGSERSSLQFGRAQTFSLDPSTPGNIAGSEDFFTGVVSTIMWVRDVNGDGDTLDEGLGERLPGGARVDVEITDFFGNVSQRSVVVDRANPQLPFGAVALSPLPVDPATLGYAPVDRAQLPEYNGQPISIYDVGDNGALGESRFVPFLGNALSPEDETYGVALALDQELMDGLQLNLSLDYSTTDKVSNNNGNADLFNVDAESLSNPFLQDMRYAFVTGFPQQQQVVDQRAISLTGGLDWTWSDDWTVRFGFGLGDNKNNSDTLNEARSFSFGSEFQPNVRDLINGFRTFFDDNFNQIREELGTDFNDPLLGFASQDEFVAAVIEPFQHTHNHSTSRDVDVGLEGNLFATAAGDVRVIFNLAHRRETYEIFNNTLRFASEVLSGDGEGGGAIDVDFEERYGTSTNAVAAEIAVPLIGEDNALPLVEDLLFSASARYEDYSRVDDNGFNWAAGFNWALNDWMTIRLNRTYSLRVPEAVRSARDQEFRRFSSYRVQADPDDFFNSVTVFEPRWEISGGSDHLESERNYGTALGFIFRPTFIDGLDIQLNFTESETVDQIGSPLAANILTPDTLLPENIAANPFITRADPENVPLHAEMVFVDFLGNVIAAQPGDLIVDQRAFNVGDTFNRGVDLNVRYNYSSEFGDWLVTWRHQYLDVNEVVQSDACAEDRCISNRLITGQDRMFDDPVDTVGTIDRSNFGNIGEVALPRNKGSLEVYWSYRGLGVTLSTNYQDETSLIQLPRRENNALDFDDPAQRVNIFKETTKPEQSVDMVLSYDFASGDLFSVPAWLSTTRISLSLDDVWRRERSVTTEFIQREFEPEVEPFEVNRFGFEPRGRAYSLRISSSF